MTVSPLGNGAYKRDGLLARTQCCVLVKVIWQYVVRKMVSPDPVISPDYVADRSIIVQSIIDLLEIKNTRDYWVNMRRFHVLNRCSFAHSHIMWRRVGIRQFR